MPSRSPTMARTNSITGNGSSGPAAGRARRMTLGGPVVPDEYSMAAPSDASGTGVAGYPATSASQGSQPAGRGPGPVISMRSRPGHFAAAALATSRLAAELNSTFARELATTDATSSAPR